MFTSDPMLFLQHPEAETETERIAVDARQQPCRNFSTWWMWILQVLLLCTSVQAQATNSIGMDGTFETGGVCYTKVPFDRKTMKSVYHVGVLAIRGFDAAYAEFNETFSTYLSLTAGTRFAGQDISFVMKPLNFTSMFVDTEARTVDFLYVNPSAFSCIESEYEAYSLVSQLSERTVANQTYYLNKFGGVIMARADDDRIQTLQDLKGKIVAAASISGLGSGQMQFRAMINAGMDYINDPKQLVFTSNQGKVVNGVLSGKFDVGFVRTDQMERTKDALDNPVNTSLLKVIDPLPNLVVDGRGVAFPYPSSTPLYPEWNVAALAHVDPEVSRQVQQAMLLLATHAEAAPALEACRVAHNTTTTANNNDTNYCQTLEQTDFPNGFTISTPVRCDTTPDIARSAARAMTQGEYSGWTPTLSYMQLRSMQEAVGFIEYSKPNQEWRCIRSDELYDSITCPPGQRKKSQLQVTNACAKLNIPCATGYQCICQPCFTPTNCIDSVHMLGRCVSYPVLLSSILVPAAVLFLTIFFFLYSRKSQQMVRQAKHSAQKERDLNEFMAHEVRNPLAAALSACTFVSYAMKDDKIVTSEERAILKEDLTVIDSSLKFISDLMRSILDSHRCAAAVNGKHHHKTAAEALLLEHLPCGVLCDLFESVASVIYTRDTNFKVEMECEPNDLVILGDRLRLNQVLLNLARNASKFVLEGFVRLRAAVVDGHVHLYVEDSGPGIPLEKRTTLFTKFQQSLDTLAQGTGLGLNLCQTLVTAMGGEIYLDTEYTSGFQDYPGTRIVINLKQAPFQVSEEEEDEDGERKKNVQVEQDSSLGQQQHQQRQVLKTASSVSSNKSSALDSNGKSSTTTRTQQQQLVRQESAPPRLLMPTMTTPDMAVATAAATLPQSLSILFVDDDRILRKQGVRAIARLLPKAAVREAASGEAALHICLVEQEEFDVIFMDQYMTSHEQTMLGTETVRALRSNNVKSIVCGLSANNLEDLFINAGCDAFWLKPFPCRNEELLRFLQSLLKDHIPVSSKRATAAEQLQEEEESEAEAMILPENNQNQGNVTDIVPTGDGKDDNTNRATASNSTESTAPVLFGEDYV